MTVERPVALISGANRGIGREVAAQLAERGQVVYLGGRDPDNASRTAAELQDRAADAATLRPVQLDVTDTDSIERAVATIGEEAGRLDVLINNAAVHYDSWQRASAPDFVVVREAMETNLFGAWQLTIAALDLLGRSEQARIVNVSSGAAALSDMGAGTPAYRVSKVGLNALTRMLADELRPTGILVNAVCPGWVATDMGGAGGRPVGDGAAGIVWAATLPGTGPTGGFFRDGQPIDW